MTAKNELTIDDVLPDDKDRKKYMDIADTLDSKTYNEIGQVVHNFLKGTQFTESDYKSGIGFMYSKGV